MKKAKETQYKVASALALIYTEEILDWDLGA